MADQNDYECGIDLALKVDLSAQVEVDSIEGPPQQLPDGTWVRTFSPIPIDPK